MVRKVLVGRSVFAFKMTKVVSKNRQIRIKLIDLVKPHEMLYDSSVRGYDKNYDRRCQLWDEIVLQMNRTFQMNLGNLYFPHVTAICNANQKLIFSVFRRLSSRRSEELEIEMV